MIKYTASGGHTCRWDAGYRGQGMCVHTFVHTGAGFHRLARANPSVRAKDVAGKRKMRQTLEIIGQAASSGTELIGGL